MRARAFKEATSRKSPASSKFRSTGEPEMFAPSRPGFVTGHLPHVSRPQFPKSAGPRHRWVFGSLYRFPSQPPKVVRDLPVKE
jgi:hypothetical protein